MDAAETLAPDVGTAAACRAMGVSRATLYRRRHPMVPRNKTRPKRQQPRALDHRERQEVLDVLHSPRFVDKGPATVYAALLDEGTYHCSVRTMYRILHDHQEVRERRNQLRHARGSGSARHVDDRNALAHERLKQLGRQAAQLIGTAARPKWNDKFDRA